MLDAEDRAYYRRRMIEERRMAEQAVHALARAAHAELARAYELRLAVDRDMSPVARAKPVLRPLEPLAVRV